VGFTPVEDDLYREIILDHYRRPRHAGRIAEPSAVVEANNPLCGDEIVLTVRRDGATLADVAFEGQGCSISQASASMLCDTVIGIDIVSLGLIYDTHIDDAGLLTIDMTLTTPYCPLGPVIETQAHAVCAPLPGVKDVHVNLVWAPPWDPRTMASDEAKLQLG